MSVQAVDPDQIVCDELSVLADRMAQLAATSDDQEAVEAWAETALRIAMQKAMPDRGRMLRTHRERKRVSAVIRTAVFERDAYRCVECGDYRSLCIDHIVPLVRGGTSAIGNLQTLCRDCNGRKGARLGS